MGAVAGIDIQEGRYGYQQGLFVIGQSGEMVRILNDKKFQPRFWFRTISLKEWNQL